MTNVTGLNSSPSYHIAPGNVAAQRFSISTDTANNLGYGVGKIVIGVCDSFWNTWQKMWTPKLSTIEIAEQRNYVIYEGGLKECVKLLGPALAKLQMNTRDHGTLKKVEQLAAHFARYLIPSDEGNLQELQSKILKPLEERVSILARLHIKNVLSKLMPVFFQGNNSMSEKTHSELQRAHTRGSQVMEELPRAKAKRSPQAPAPSNSPTINRANGFEMTDSAGFLSHETQIRKSSKLLYGSLVFSG
ncbi:MAG: hypothetical protein H0T62_13575 [Parachlamydiaceae bacterium]|nr:hypothetical protein [Parachlamydiaceae bacterium]